MDKPRISIITPSFQAERFIEATVQSVLSQGYPALEYIVMDGGSTDGTLDILRPYEERLQWVSQPDSGQADAINNGMQHATGDLLAYLNADDLYLPGTLANVARYFADHPDALLLYGDAEAIDERDRSYGLRANVRPCDFAYLLHIGDAVVQPAAFWRRELWQQLGPLDTRYQYVFDYEYWLRAARVTHLHYWPIPLARERIHSNAKTSVGGLRRIRELDQLGRQYGGDGIPAKFRPEAAATLLRAAQRADDPATARAYRREARAVNNHAGKLALYLLSMMIFGEAAIPRLRLLSNRLRYRLGIR